MDPLRIPSSMSDGNLRASNGLRGLFRITWHAFFIVSAIFPAQRAWTRSCAVCGSEVDGGAFAKGVDPTELLDMVRRSTAGEMDVLGAMSHAGTGSEPGAPVFFARERSTHELVAMRLAGRTLDAAGRSDITLGVIALPGIGTAALPEAGAPPPSKSAVCRVLPLSQRVAISRSAPWVVGW